MGYAMKTIQCIFLILLTLLFSSSAFSAETISKSFELRYISNDTAADGETDYIGGNTVLDTDQRVEFLKKYADFASKFFDDPNYDYEIVKDDEVASVLRKIKPQPQPKVRERIVLNDWKWLGYLDGQHEESLDTLKKWNARRGCTVKNEALAIKGSKRKVTIEIDPQEWRFSFRWRMKQESANASAAVALVSPDKKTVMKAQLSSKGAMTVSNGESMDNVADISVGNWVSCKLEADFTERCWNYYVNGEKTSDYIPMKGDAVSVESIVLTVNGTMLFDDFYGQGHTPTDNVRKPYTFETYIDENFKAKPALEGWADKSYDDNAWDNGELPIVHGGERFAGEDLYLRKQVRVGEFERAVLNVEAIDPEGEIWLNGRVVAVLPNRHPARIDLTRYLEKNAENTIAVRVMHYNLDEYGHVPMGHTPLDHNMGWFAGRMSLDLTSQSFIDDVFVTTGFIGSNNAILNCRLQLRNEAPLSFSGTARVRVYRWFPSESSEVAGEMSVPVVIGNGEKVFNERVKVDNPELWTWDDPNLYKVEVSLEDAEGNVLDDYVVTTGIRTVSQEGGTFRVNGEPEMLNGAQTFGFRPPFENLTLWSRTCPPEVIVQEFLQIMKMNGNLLRIHVHGWSDPASNINDPRIAEIADQLGCMLIWATPAWIRTSAGWGPLDFEGYPKYMRQVYNHPSIVMWEASNHPNKFKSNDYSESNLFVEKVYDTIYPVDQSRLISISSFIKHMHYGNDLGTIDQEGNPMKPTPSWTAPMVTRGNQDSFMGYGHTWPTIREQPTPYYKSFLDSPHRAYFNFEHEESIGQPNWNLVKGKPWYKLQSYEWKYDDGSIGRYLSDQEWRESQAWQAFSAWESMKKQRMIGYDGFSWCCLHGGPNSVTYKKPIIDYNGRAKLGWHANKMVFQRVAAGSADVDIVYGPGDAIKPMIMNLDGEKNVTVTVTVKTPDGRVVDKKDYNNVVLSGGRSVTNLDEFKPKFGGEGYYFVEYAVVEQ